MTEPAAESSSGLETPEPPTLHWSSEEIASFVTSSGHGRVLVVRPGPADGDRVVTELRGAGYRVGHLPLTREVSHVPTAAATFVPDLVYVALTEPVEPCLAALELLAADPRTGWLPLVALVDERLDPKIVAVAYERAGCDFLSAKASDVELLARTHLLVRLAKAIAQTGRAPDLGPPEPEVANAPAGDTRFLTDPDTGVHTRTYLDHRLPAEIARARRYQRPLSVLVVRLEGDAVDPARLSGAATVLTRRVRTCDVVARLGTAAFAVVLPETTVDDAGVLAARLHADFEDRAEAASIGVAGLDEPRAEAHTPAGLLETAARRAAGGAGSV